MHECWENEGGRGRQRTGQTDGFVAGGQTVLHNV